MSNTDRAIVIKTARALTIAALVCLVLPVQAEDERHATAAAQRALGEDLLRIADEGSVDDILDAAARAVSDRVELVGAHTPAAVEPLEAELRNIEASREILALLDNHEDPLRQAVEAARVADRLHAAQLGVELPVLPPASTMQSPAVLALAVAERHGVTPTDPQLEEIASLDTLDDDSRSALAATLAAYLAFDHAARSLADEYDAEVGLAPTPASLGELLVARIALAESTIPLRDAFVSQELGGAMVPPIIDLCPALAIDPVGTNTDYPDDCALIIDVGGNDNYDNNAGGSDFLGLGCDDFVRGAAALIDLLGDDDYGDPGRGCGVNGGGYSGKLSIPFGAPQATPGVGFLLDAQGQDEYFAGPFGTNGGGYGAFGIGLGFLIDASGNDTYVAGHDGTNGGGLGWVGGAGFGFLFDGGGDDDYEADSRGTNGGGAGDGPATGRGFLLDAGGSDDYVASAAGVNGGAHTDPFVVSTSLTAGSTAFGYLADVDQIGPNTNTFTAGFQGANGGAATSAGDVEDRSAAVGFLFHHGFGSGTCTASGAGTNGGAKAGSVPSPVEKR